MVYKTKIYSQRIDINDINDIYSPKDIIAMKYIKKLYEGKCLKGALIKKILDIKYISDLKISHLHNFVKGIIDVSFIAEIYQINQSDIILCEIMDKGESRVGAKTEFAKIIMKQHSLLNTVDRGELIPVIVKQTFYKPYKSEVTLYCVPMLPVVPIKKYIYVIDNELSQLQLDKINDYLKKVNELKTKHRKISNALLKKKEEIDCLFYPFKSQKKPEILTKNKKIKILDITLIKYNEFKGGIFIPSCEIRQSKPLVLFADIKELSNIEKFVTTREHYNIIKENAFTLLESFFISYIKYNEFLYEMMEKYTVTKNSLYWKSVKDYKQ